MQPLTLTGWMRWAIVRDVLPPDVQSLLEIGAGLGSMGGMLAARSDYLGVEPDPVSRAIAAKRTGGRVVATVEEAEGVFDLVCAFEVIEHLKDEEEMLSSWRAKSRRWLLVSTPAGPERFGPWDELAGHYRRHSSLSLLSSLRAAGWEAVLMRRYGFPVGEWLDTTRQLLGRWYGPASLEARTASSGRHLQPPPALAWATWAAALPARGLQRYAPRRGSGFIALAVLRD